MSAERLGLSTPALSIKFKFTSTSTLTRIIPLVDSSLLLGINDYSWLQIGARQEWMNICGPAKACEQRGGELKYYY